MSQALHIPEDLYARIAAYAAEHKEDPDAIATRLLAQALDDLPPTEQQPRDLSQDPLSQLAGIISVEGDPGWGDRHDEYFAWEGDDAEEQ